MNLKKLSVAVALMASMAVPAFAETKVGVVDMQALLENSTSVKKLGEDLRAKFASRQKTIADLQKTVDDENKALKTNTATMQASKLSQARNKLNADMSQLQQLQAQFMQDVGVERNKAMESVYQKVQSVVGEVAKKEGLTVVLATRLTLYAEPSIDITSEVQKELN